MSMATIPKLIQVYYNELTEGKMIEKAKKEAKKYKISLSAFIKYLIKDSEIITSNANSEINIVRKKIISHEKIHKN